MAGKYYQHKKKDREMLNAHMGRRMLNVSSLILTTTDSDYESRYIDTWNSFHKLDECIVLVH